MYVSIYRYFNLILNVCILMLIELKVLKPWPETMLYLSGLVHFLREKSNYRFHVPNILIKKKKAVFLKLAQIFLNEDFRNMPYQ